MTSIKLAPKYWSATRGRLAAAELAREIGPVTVPPATMPEQQVASG